MKEGDWEGQLKVRRGRERAHHQGRQKKDTKASHQFRETFRHGVEPVQNKKKDACLSSLKGKHGEKKELEKKEGEHSASKTFIGHLP